MKKNLVLFTRLVSALGAGCFVGLMVWTYPLPPSVALPVAGTVTLVFGMAAMAKD